MNNNKKHEPILVEKEKLLAKLTDSRIPDFIDIASPSTSVLLFAGENPCLSFAGTCAKSAHIQFCKSLRNEFKDCKTIDDVRTKLRKAVRSAA